MIAVVWLLIAVGWGSAWVVLGADVLERATATGTRPLWLPLAAVAAIAFTLIAAAGFIVCLAYATNGSLA